MILIFADVLIIDINKYKLCNLYFRIYYIYFVYLNDINKNLEYK